MHAEEARVERQAAKKKRNAPFTLELPSSLGKAPSADLDLSYAFSLLNCSP